MTTEELKKYKQIYSDIAVSDNLVEKKWELLMPFLPKQEVRNSYPFISYTVAFLSVLILIAIGAVGVSQAAKPGDPFYPVKILSQSVSAKVASAFQKSVSEIIPGIIYRQSQPSKQKQTSSDTKDATPAFPSIHVNEQTAQQANGNGNGANKATIPSANQSNKPTLPPKNQEHGNSDAAKQTQEVKGIEVSGEHSQNPNASRPNTNIPQNGNQRGSSKSKKPS